jgi:hypothetical protein
LRDRLAHAGFKEKFLGEHQPPATHYQLGDEEGSFYVEFLTPLIGGEYDREGNRRATTQVAGITSQNLRYVDLLLASPWKVDLSPADGFFFDKVKEVRVPSPTRFIAQKLLIYERRDRRARAKEILYLHDTIELFGASLDVLQEEWKGSARQELSKNAILTIEEAALVLFSKMSDEIRGGAVCSFHRRGEVVEPRRTRVSELHEEPFSAAAQRDRSAGPVCGFSAAVRGV